MLFHFQPKVEAVFFSKYNVQINVPMQVDLILYALS